MTVGVSEVVVPVAGVCVWVDCWLDSDVGAVEEEGAGSAVGVEVEDGEGSGVGVGFGTVASQVVVAESAVIGAADEEGSGLGDAVGAPVITTVEESELVVTSPSACADDKDRSA